MKIYVEKPTARRARQVWEYFTAVRGREPIQMWKNANCWGGGTSQFHTWGWWVGSFGGVGGTDAEYADPREIDMLLAEYTTKEDRKLYGDKAIQIAYNRWKNA